MMQHITWPRGVICHSFGSLLFLSFLSLHLPLFTSPPFHFYLFASFSLSFLHFLPSNRSHYCFNGSAPTSASKLSAKITGNRTSKWRCIPGCWKGMCKVKRAGLEEQRTGICKKGYRQERAGVHPLIQARSRAPLLQQLIKSSTGLLSGIISPRKNIFHSHRMKNK